MTNAQQYYEHNARAMRPARKAFPDVMKGFGELHKASMHSGGMEAKQRELIAFAIGLSQRCENCIYAHARAALNAGATAEEILDAAGVAVMMGGGPVYTYLPRVTEALEALDALDTKSAEA